MDKSSYCLLNPDRSISCCGPLQGWESLPAAPLTEDLNIQQPMLEHSAMYRKNHWV